MRLKQLEIKGFKSFADKTVLNFDEGITGIIGPNGCGKSNIIDSIRWVIGEQKISALRSENLEALVFNGSKTRTASGLAEVSLTFENTKNLLPTEFSTVTVTRRFYKNGESEYRLNDVTCRLRDIHNLFLDTGVSNDSYAIIELGMVDDIIKDKENSRRRMLEQAAGITIYKTRKKEAKLKLEATEADLNRIDDLLFEINNQLKVLESQAKKAEKYHEVKAEYKNISVELAKAALQGFNLSYKNLTQQQQEAAEKKALLEKEIAAAEEDIEISKTGFAGQEQQLQALHHGFNELQQVMHSKESEKNLCSQRLNHLQEKEENITEFLKKTESQQKNIEDSILYTQNLFNNEEENIQVQQQKLGDISGEANEKRNVLSEKKSVTDKLREKQQQVQRHQFELEKNAAVNEASIQNIQRNTVQLQQEQQNRKTHLNQLEKEAVEKENVLQDKKQLLEQYKTRHEEAKQQILQTQSKLDALRNNLGEENRRLDARRNEHSLLKNLIDTMEGYPESVQFLHKNTEWNNQAPILSDIIYVQEAYRAAIENVLSPYLNYYVVRNLEEGMKAVELLVQKNKGKANFLLLDKINVEGVTVAPQPQNTITALSVIEVEEPYKQLAAYLLNNVFIAESEDALLQSENAVILEKNGKYVKGKYVLSGGSTGSFEGKRIGRAQNLKKLDDVIANQQKKVNDLKDEIKLNHDEVINLNAQLKEQLIRQTETEINQLVNAAFALRNKSENIQTAYSNAEKQLKDLQTRLLSEIAASEQIANQLKEVSDSLLEVQNDMKNAEEHYRQAEQEYQKASGTYNQANVEFIQQQNKLQSLKQEITFKENQLKELQLQIVENTRKLTQVADENFQMNNSLNKIDKDYAELTNRKTSEEQALKKADNEFYRQRQLLQAAENELRNKIKSREITDYLLAEIKDKLNELKLQLAGMRERLMVEFKIEIDSIIDEERKTTSSVEELQATNDRLKKRLENMGEINPTAIEAFDEMKKRFDFITDQKNDLVSAKQSLLQTIQEVEESANQQFLTTFNLVRENFQKVFKALFTEADTADLVLENPDNLAETGVDVIAKPKGKKPSSITQLSGGEKTLTATALLFAIYLIKPAPFCILDEVDAPLDDANVNKFTGMIQQFSQNSQFIIVTHNKSTMSTVDVIYGVTMQEPGVSKLVSVDFRNLN